MQKRSVVHSASLSRLSKAEEVSVAVGNPNMGPGSPQIPQGSRAPAMSTVRRVESGTSVKSARSLRTQYGTGVKSAWSLGTQSGTSVKSARSLRTQSSTAWSVHDEPYSFEYTSTAFYQVGCM